jgi:hypothetical protein
MSSIGLCITKVRESARRTLRGRRQGGIFVGLLIAVAAIALLLLVVSGFSPNVRAEIAQNDLPTAQNPVVAKVFDPVGNETDTEPLIIVANNQLRVSVPEPKSSFRPGRYKLRLWIWQNGVIYFTENDFTWGVLAVNFNKSVYTLGDRAKIGFGVLSDTGRTICDAAIDMDITLPSGKLQRFSTEMSGHRMSAGTSDVQNIIARNPSCGPGTVTNEPDYSASLVASETGTYNVSVVATTANGTRQISDKFSAGGGSLPTGQAGAFGGEVQNAPLFDVERFAPTRIYPPANYNVSIVVKANQDFAGNISETVPASFDIATEKLTQKTFTKDTQTISWPVNLKKGESVTLNYSFKAPDVSPELYKLGPLQIGNWQETRQWQIAADAIANTVIVITSTASTTWTVPSDWNNASNTIELIGGGGGGVNGVVAGAPGGGGGGGGAYAKISNFSTSTTGGSVRIQVATGGGPAAAGQITFFNWKGSGATSTCSAVTMSLCAAAGVGGSTSSGGAGGTTANSVATSTFGAPTSTYAGGTGGNGAITTAGRGGGGGGGAGGPNGAGANGGAGGAVIASGGGGGGGNGGGTIGGTSTSTSGAAGGNSFNGTLGGASSTGAGNPGSSGSGGSGGAGTTAAGSAFKGGNGSKGAEWSTATPASGSGGGAGGGGGDTYTTGTGNNAGSAGNTIDNTGAGGGGGGSCADNATGCTASKGSSGASGVIVITYTPAIITLANGTQPTGVTIGPGANATTSAVFTLVTADGTSTITSVTVGLATTTGVYQVKVADNAGTTVYGSSTNPGSTSLTINTTDATMSVTSTTATTFRTMISPLSHVNMPAVPGGTYIVTSTVTSFVDSKSWSHAGSNTTWSTTTIDNASPNDVTNASGTASGGQVALSWTDSGNTDATTTIVRTTSTVGVTWSPTEGTYYTAGQAVTATNTIACVVASSTANCTDTSVVNGTSYYYKIFTADTYLNYSAGAFQGTLPLTPNSNVPPTVVPGSVVLNHSNPITLTPNATTSFDINYTVSDDNGCTDMNTNNMTSTVFRNGVNSTCAVPNPTTNNLNCYLFITRATSSCVGTSINATDTVGIYYFAQSTGNNSSSFPTDHWEAYAVAADQLNATGSATSSNVNVNVLSAVNVTISSIDYGSLSASSTSAEQIATTTNAGNSTTSLQLYAFSTLATGTLSIATGSQRYATTTGQSWATGVALTGSPVTATGFTLATPTSTTNVAKPTFWFLNVPAGTVKDIYSGINVFSPLWAP